MSVQYNSQQHQQQHREESKSFLGRTSDDDDDVCCRLVAVRFAEKNIVLVVHDAFCSGAARLNLCVQVRMFMGSVWTV